MGKKSVNDASREYTWAISINDVGIVRKHAGFVDDHVVILLITGSEIHG